MANPLKGSVTLLNEAGNELRGASELTPRRRPRAMSPAGYRSASEFVRAALRLLEKGEREGLHHEPRPGLRRIGGGDHVE